MKIGILGPVDLKSLNIGETSIKLPKVYSFPLISYIINGLSNEGHEIIVYTLSSSINQSFVYEGANGITICIAKSYPQPGRRLFNKEVLGLLELIKQNPSDILHAHWTYEFAWAAIKSDIPYVVTIHDIASVILKNRFDPYRIIRWYMDKVTLSKGRYFIANSIYTYNKLKETIKEKTVVINNFFPKKLEYEVIELVKENYIITISNAFDKRKNIQTALSAFSIIKNKLPELKYYLVGYEMNVGGKAYNYAVENGLQDGVEFIGDLNYNDLLNLLKKALIMIHPSLEESFGMSILESMVLGTPVVGGKDSGNIPFLLDDNNTGMTCDITNPDEIAETAIKLINDKTLYSHIQIKGKQFALKEYSEKTSILKHIDLYKIILEKEYNTDPKLLIKNNVSM